MACALAFDDADFEIRKKGDADLAFTIRPEVAASMLTCGDAQLDSSMLLDVQWFVRQMADADPIFAAMSFTVEDTIMQLRKVSELDDLVLGELDDFMIDDFDYVTD